MRYSEVHRRHGFRLGHNTDLSIDVSAAVTAQGVAGTIVFLGFGGASVKSLALLRVSVQPFALVAALVLLAAGAGAVPRKQFAVVP